MPVSEKFYADLGKAIGVDAIVREPTELEAYGHDWTRVFAPKPSAIVFPKSTTDVVQVVKACAAHGVALVPSGGRTGLSGGAVAANGELVLSMTKMRRMEPVDRLARTVRVQAGAVTEAVHQHCKPSGLTWPVDFASKGSSQVGGNIATNAGGVRVIQSGMCRNWVLGLQVVTMQGEVLELNGELEKNNTGLDLRQLFIGTEGTLGIITEATLKLAPLPAPPDVFFFAVDGIGAVLRLFGEVRHAPLTVTAFEFLTDNCLELVTRWRKLKRPFDAKSSAYVLLETERAPAESRDPWLEGLFSSKLVLDGTAAQSPAEARALWSLREGISESLSNEGLPYKNDIALPISRLETFVRDLEALFAARHSVLPVYLFGHIGDGNLHVNTLKPAAMTQKEFLGRCHEADQDLFALVKKHRGSISAEHGIGLLKKDALHFSRSPEELTILRAIKKVMDPRNLLNPGKILD